MNPVKALQKHGQAVWLDFLARGFIAKYIISRLDDILSTGAWLDPKSRFQELAQDQFGLTPAYKVLGEDGPDHDKVFTIGVYVGDKLYGEGHGSSKQSAQQEAAGSALATLGAKAKVQA